MKPKKPAPLDGRERILQAAIRAFVDHGYEGASTIEVARAAGVTQPNVHHHFGSKQKLWEAAVDHLFAELRLLDPARLPLDLGPEQRIRALLTSLVDVSARCPDISGLIDRESAVPGERLDHLLDRHLRPLLQAAGALVREGQRAGVIAAGLDPDLLLYLAIGGAGHLFKVPAQLSAVFGLDVTSPALRARFARLFTDVILQGVSPAARPRAVTSRRGGSRGPDG